MQASTSYLPLPSFNNVQWSHTARVRGILALLSFGFVYILSTFVWSSRVAEEETLILVNDDAHISDISQLASSRENVVIVSHSNANYYTAFDRNSTRTRHKDVPHIDQIPSLQCIEGIISEGTGCHLSRGDVAMDIVWSWVNSSDHLWRDEFGVIEQKVTGKGGTLHVDYDSPIRHLRDYDELRYSVRSALEHLRPYTRQFHLLASDLSLPMAIQQTFNFSDSYRLGQVPQWLNPSDGPANWHDETVNLDVHHHATFFEPYTDTSFNSFGIESQLQNLRNISDTFIYLNDDMYFLKDLRPADFFTSVYGLVFRLDMYLLVPPSLDPYPQRGEWQPLRESNVLLSQRFGDCPRPYTSHMPKAVSLSLLRELGQTFGDAFSRTGGRLLRQVWRDAPGDVHTMFLLPHFVVERHREALLWSWAVARHGADDDAWDAQGVWESLGESVNGTVGVGEIERTTLEEGNVEAMLERAGHDAPAGTTYRFVSGDGYPYHQLRHNYEPDYPDMMREYVCGIKRDSCFPNNITSASEAFKHIAFATPSCGDCVINHLLKKSGSAGLSAFLPEPHRVFKPAVIGKGAETLPLNAKWQDGAFSLANVLNQAPAEHVNLREWALRLIYRYQYVLGETPSEFVFLQEERGATKAMLNINTDTNLAFACINDDINGDGRKVTEIVKSWQRGRWSTPARWEVP